MEITIKNIEETQVAYVSVTGPYDKIPEVLGEVVSYVMEENLHIIAPPYGIYFNSPLEVSPEKLKYEMGIAFIGEASGKSSVNIKKIPSHQAVSAVFKGPYGEAAQAYETIIKYAMKKSYQIIGPVKEIYLNDPMEVDEDELLTEVQFPVVKKS